MKLISNRDAFPRAVSGFVALWMTVTAVQLPTNEVIHSSYGHVIAIDCKILWQNSTSLSPTFCRKYNWVGSSAAPVSSRLICSVYGLLFCFCGFFFWSCWSAHASFRQELTTSVQQRATSCDGWVRKRRNEFLREGMKGRAGFHSESAESLLKNKTGN